MTADDAADRKVVAKCVGNPDGQPAWQGFFEHFGLRVKLWILKAMPADSEQDRDDVYQNLMFKIFSGGVLERIDPETGRPHAYLRRVTFNYCMDVHRKDADKPSSIDPEESIADEANRLADGFPPRSVDDLLVVIRKHVAEAGLDPLTVHVYNAILNVVPAAHVAKRFSLSLSTVYRHKRELLGIVRTVFGMSTAPKKVSPE